MDEPKTSNAERDVVEAIVDNILFNNLPPMTKSGAASDSDVAEFKVLLDALAQYEQNLFGYHSRTREYIFYCLKARVHALADDIARSAQEDARAAVN